MIARQFDPIAELQSAFTLLTKNYNIATIPFIAVIICFALFAFAFIVAGGTALLTGGFSDISTNPMALWPIISAAAGWFFVAIIVAIIISLIANAAAVAASESAWQSGTADVSGGFARATSRLGDLIILAMALFVM
ncbi:MAG TPA: hypothetical protein VEV38_13390, partial [Candidatus Eremiobacteraceae bacterium]|nr:hypothetical protein [Candidatus Eremiobacteraceae bacterium]